jgi:cyanate permease
LSRGSTRTSTDWPAASIVFAGGLAAGALMTKVAPALPTMRADLDLSLVESGFLQTMMYIVGGAFGVFAGALADRFGQKRFALAGLLSMVAGAALGAVGEDFVTLLVSRFVEGVGFIVFIVAAAPLLVQATAPADRPTAFAFWACYMPAGGTLALLAAPLALASFGWRGLWIGLAIFTTIVAVLLVRRVPAPSFGGEVASVRLLRESLGRPGVLALCAAFICYVGQWVSVMTWLPTFVVEERGASAATASLLTAAFVAINMPGNVAAGLLMRRGVSRSAILAAGAAAMGFSAIGMLTSAAPDWVRIACLLAFSLLGGFIPSAVLSGTPVHARSPQHVATTYGMVMQASHLGQFVLPIVVAWSATRFGGWSASLGTMLGLAAVGVVAAIAVGRCEIRQQLESSR